MKEGEKHCSHVTPKKCAKCSAKYHLNASKLCVENVCTCANGRAVTNDRCDEHDANFCVDGSCQRSFRFETNSNSCEKNICSPCEFGEDDICDTHGGVFCLESSCREETVYNPDTKQCEKCPAGTLFDADKKSCEETVIDCGENLINNNLHIVLAIDHSSTLSKEEFSNLKNCATSFVRSLPERFFVSAVTIGTPNAALPDKMSMSPTKAQMSDLIDTQFTQVGAEKKHWVQSISLAFKQATDQFREATRSQNHPELQNKADDDSRASRIVLFFTDGQYTEGDGYLRRVSAKFSKNTDGRVIVVGPKYRKKNLAITNNQKANFIEKDFDEACSPMVFKAIREPLCAEMAETNIENQKAANDKAKRSDAAEWFWEF